jgi:hypothetical protein
LEAESERAATDQMSSSFKTRKALQIAIEAVTLNAGITDTEGAGIQPDLIDGMITQIIEIEDKTGSYDMSLFS